MAKINASIFRRRTITFKLFNVGSSPLCDILANIFLEGGPTWPWSDDLTYDDLGPVSQKKK